MGDTIFNASFSESLSVQEGSGFFTKGFNDRLKEFFKTCQDGKYILSIERVKKQRSLNQNARYWAILEGYSKASGYTKEELHEALKMRILGTRSISVFGSQFGLAQSSASLTKEEFIEYCNKAEVLLKDFYG